MTDPADFTACAAWRWLPGMRWRLTPTAGGHSLGRLSGRVLDDGNGIADDGSVRDLDDGCLPDLTDPATLGAIEHGILASAGVWIECAAHHDGTPRWCARTEDGPVPTVGGGRWWRRTLAAALLDGLRAVTP